MMLQPFQVIRELGQLKQGKALGSDDISPRLLMTCAVGLGDILTHLFNLSLNLEKVPRLWKTSCLVPVPKRSNPSDDNDYRPIALTSRVMKMFERLVLSYISWCVYSYGPLAICISAEN